MCVRTYVITQLSTQSDQLIDNINYSNLTFKTLPTIVLVLDFLRE